MTVFNLRRLAAGTGLAVIIAAGSATAIIDGIEGAKAEAANAAVAPAAVPVSVATVETQDVTTWQEFSGRLEAIDRVDVRSRVAGAIQSANFREGALVKKGDLLLQIDPAPFQAAVAAAKAEVSAAEARVELAKLELDRGRKLIENRTVSQSDVDQRASAYNEATANLQAAQAALQSSQLQLGYTRITAPISGRVGKLQITVGNLVAAGAASPVMTTLVSVDPIYASFDVDEKVVSRALAELGASDAANRPVEDIPVEIQTDASTPPIRGRLQFIDNEVDTASGTVHVRAVFDNHEGLLFPGQFVRVRVGQPKPTPQVLISERAVGTDQDRKFVLVVGANDTLAYRQVELGDWVDGLRIVTSGLKAGDRIVVDGLQRVRPGAVVSPQTVAMASLSEAATPTDVAEQ
ncbi:Efflux pump periplasmic linker BepF [Hartmannibacter diazotrophicus]|uniref:Efflux pump periplasmic linker BepF n=1 Tax=Hartmannibacter diazotrophicus TaxID=1482074 RepID=A0A2C9D1F8_9HYPH|nr:efflux RND transporter periplasmic adaptor subunit [Hartmannibacter diazotrophicus]SON54019.1 Efflux pump periplasmic linker BepF [Hartmannibacter diazotrophicus]